MKYLFSKVILFLKSNLTLCAEQETKLLPLMPALTMKIFLWGKKKKSAHTESA